MSDPHASIAASEQPTNVRWTIFSLACGTSFLLYLHRYTWNFIAVFLETDYGFTKTELGTLFTFFIPTYGGGQIPSGIICDAIGAHAFLASTMIVGAVILPCYAISNSFSTLAVMRLTFGAAQAGTYPSLSKVTATWFPVKSRTIMQGWIATFFGRSGGAMSSIVLGTVLIGMLGLSWQTSLVVMGGLGVLFATLFFALFRNSPDTDPRVNDAERELIYEGSLAPSENAPRILPWRRVVRSRTLLFFVIQQITSAGADTVYVSFMGLYFVSARGFDIAEAGFLVSLPLFGGATGGILGGYLNDWLVGIVGRRWARCCVGFTGKSAACVLMFVAIAQQSGVAAAWALFFVKFFSDWSQPTVWGTCTDLGGRMYSATVFGIINTSGSFGGFCTPIIFGIVLDHYTTKQVVDGIEKMVTDYNPIFYLVAMLYMISACCWFLIDSTQSLENELKPNRQRGDRAN